MRDYSKISGAFWTGKTGKGMRGDMDAQIVALYLMSSPHANMIGVYILPVGYIHIDTGLSLEGASKGLDRLIKDGFCTYDRDSETVFVHEMAKFQIADTLKPTDNRVKDIQKQYDSLPESPIKSAFHEKYHASFHLINADEIASPLQAPLKPEAGTGTGTESGKNKTIVRSPSRFEDFWGAWPKSPRKVAKSVCLKRWNSKKLDAIADQVIGHVIAIQKTHQWQSGFDPAPLTYLNQGRWADEIFEGDGKSAGNSKPWYISNSGINAKGKELGIEYLPDEIFPNYKVRVYKEAGISSEDVRKALQDFGDKK